MKNIFLLIYVYRQPVYVAVYVVEYKIYREGGVKIEDNVS